MKKSEVRELVITSLFIALVYIFTWLIKIQLPIGAKGGLIHLGNIPFFIAAILFGKKVGMLSGAIGMGLFDLTSGWVTWAPITFITCLVMGYAISVINGDKVEFKKLILSFFAAAILKVLGYYIGEAILFSSLVVPLASIPGNLIQIAVSSIIILIIIKPLESAFNYISNSKN